MNKNERMEKAIDALLLKAEQATPGPWQSARMPEEGTIGVWEKTPGCNSLVCGDCRPQDAAYIAACNPEAVSAIIRYLRKQIDAQHDAIEALTGCGPEKEQPQEQPPASSLEMEAETLATWLANAYLGRDLLPDIDSGMSPPDPACLREAAQHAVGALSDPEIMPLRGMRVAVGKKADRPEQGHA